MFFLSEIGISYEWLTMCHCVHRLVKDRDDPLLCNELSGGTSTVRIMVSFMYCDVYSLRKEVKHSGKFLSRTLLLGS